MTISFYIWAYGTRKKKLKKKNKNLKIQIINLKYKIVMRKPRMVVAMAIKKENKLNLDVLVEVSGQMQ